MKITIENIAPLHGVIDRKVDYFLINRQFLEKWPVMCDCCGNYWLLDGHHRFVAYCLYLAGYSNVNQFFKNEHLDFYPKDITKQQINIDIKLTEDIYMYDFLKKNYISKKYTCEFSKYIVFPCSASDNYDSDSFNFYKNEEYLQEDKKIITKYLKDHTEFNKFIKKANNKLNIEVEKLIEYIEKAGYKLIVQWYAYVNYTNPDEYTEYDFKTFRAKDNDWTESYSFDKKQLIERIKKDNFSKIEKNVLKREIWLLK